MQVGWGKGDTPHDLYLRVIKGQFLGMTVGFRVLEDAKSRGSEILMTARHPFDKLPLPKLFMEFGLEVVFQQLGHKLRRKIESNPLAP